MLRSGERIQRYEIIRLLGKGGMGEVYLAQDTALDRKVAVKLLPDTLTKDPKAKERFLREAKAAAALDHPFICKVFEAGDFQGTSFIAMEYVEGQNLSDKIASGPLPLGDALKAALEVAEALEAAHAKGIVHRDLKPSNLICTPQGHIKVMDFGLAKYIISEPRPGELDQTVTRTLGGPPSRQSITSPGVVVGTIAYMSPEQAKGEPVDARTDIFALGITLAEMVSGKHPFERATPLETVTAVLRDNPPPVHVTPKALNPGLSRILHKALAKDPAMRYQRIGDMAADIRTLQAEIAPGRWMGFRSPWVMAGTLAAVALILVGAGLMFFKHKTPGATPPPKIVKVLIADFDNKTGDPVFDGALEPAFRIELEGSPLVEIFDRAKARDIAGGSRLDKDKALLVSRREGINIVVSASIEAAANQGYKIQMEAVDPVSLAKVSQASETVRTKAEIMRVADSLAAKLRTDLGELPEASARDIGKETFTASSLDAMKAYARAQDLATMGNDDEAIKEFEKALALDPNLGRAYAGLAVVYRNRGDLGKATTYYEKAMPFLDQMTEREKYRTRGGYYFVHRNYRKAIEEYEALMRQFPMDLAAQVNLPLAYFYARDMPKAFEEGKKAVEAYPGKVNPLYNYVWYAIGAGRFDVAEAEIPKIMKLDPKFAEPHVCLALIRLSQGKADEAARECRAIEAMGAYPAALASAGLADIALFEGRWGDARKVLEAGIAADIAGGQKSMAVTAQGALARTLLDLGEKKAALTTLESALASGVDEGGRLTAAMVLLDSGNEERARAIAAELGKLLQPEPQAYAKLIEGAIALKRKDFAGAVGRFHEAQASLDTWIGHVLLGRAYLEAGQFTEAHSEFDLCLQRRGEAFSVFLDDLPTLRYLPQIYYYLGRAQEGLKIPAAKESFKKYLEIKILAVGDPMVEDAKRRLNGL